MVCSRDSTRADVQLFGTVATVKLRSTAEVSRDLAEGMRAGADAAADLRGDLEAFRPRERTVFVPRAGGLAAGGYVSRAALDSGREPLRVRGPHEIAWQQIGRMLAQHDALSTAYRDGVPVGEHHAGTAATPDAGPRIVRIHPDSIEALRQELLRRAESPGAAAPAQDVLARLS